MPLSHQSSGIRPTAVNFSTSAAPIGPSQHLVRLRRVLEDERQAEGGDLGDEAGGGALAVGGQVERAGPHAGQHRDVVAELLGAGDVDDDLAVGALGHHLGEGLGRDGARVARRGAVAEGQRRRGARPARAEGQRRGGDGDAGALEEGPAIGSDGHGVSLLVGLRWSQRLVRREQARGADSRLGRGSSEAAGLSRLAWSEPALDAGGHGAWRRCRSGRAASAARRRPGTRPAGRCGGTSA